MDNFHHEPDESRNEDLYKDDRSTISKSTISEIAGQRLYQNALDTKKKIKEKIVEAGAIPKEALNLATRGRKSREPSPMPGDRPRYIQLYENAKAKQIAKSENEVSTLDSKIDLRDASPSRNKRCERLYDLSSRKQTKGKERRDEIMKSKEKPPLPESHFKKIQAADAAKMYERGMKSIISLEMKRMKAAFESEEVYVSPLVPRSTE